MIALRSGLIYFFVVFGAGFLMAPVREWLLAPRIGAFWAELAEMPVMLSVIVLAAGWTARRPTLAGHAGRALGAGLFALSLMLLAEFLVMRFVRELTIAEYLAGREPVPGAIYGFSLLVFGLLPAWFARFSNRRAAQGE